MTENELEFVIFCVESIASQYNMNASAVYNKLSRESNIINNYIIPCYDALHTQDKNYIVNDIIGVMNDRGVNI